MTALKWKKIIMIAGLVVGGLMLVSAIGIFFRMRHLKKISDEDETVKGQKDLLMET